MKKKTKTFILVLSLCMAAFSLTACSDIKGIYDFFTDSDFGEAFENLENMDSDDIKNLIENLEESDFEGLIDDLSGVDDDSESGGYKYDSENDEDDSSFSNSDFDLGNVDGNLYSNSFLGIMCELDSDWRFYTDNELAAINNVTFNNLEDAGDTTAKEALENGTIYIIMYTQNQENLDNLNIALQYFGFDITDYYTVESLIDNSLPNLEITLTAQGMKDVSATRTTTTFLGETVPCAEITGSINGTPIYEKQVYLVADDYMATITAASVSGEDTTQEILDTFSAY